MIAIAAGVYIYRKKQNTTAQNMIPQIIHTRDGSIECITLDSLQVAVGCRTTVAVDKSCASISTADETLSINSNDADHDDEEEEEEEEEEDDDDDEDHVDDNASSSAQSAHTNDSGRCLLEQARQRVQHQMILDENKVLQAEVTQARVEVESILRQKLDIKNERDTLESKLAEAMLTIQQYKLNELHLMEEKAQRERDYMNQLNDFAQETKRNDQILMDEIMKRDQLIRELQSRLNQADGRKSGMEDNKMDSVSVEVDMDDESWSEDDVSCEFV